MKQVDTLHDEFTSAAHTWQQLRNARDTSADSYYEKHVFPEVFRRFASSIQQEHRVYRGLILLGSGQPDTAALLIAGLNPERVAFLLTSTTQQFHTQVQHRLDALGLTQSLRCPPDQWLPTGEPPKDLKSEDEYRDLHSDHSTVLNTYRGVRLVLEQWNDLPRVEVAVDLTAGKSTMTVGLAKSAHVLGLPSIYIDSDYELNTIKQGTQHLASTANPYIVFGELEAAEAFHQYEQHDYGVSAQLFGKLAQRMTKTEGAHLHQRYTALATLSGMYAEWDVLDIRSALHHARQLDLATNVLSMHHVIIKRHIDILERLEASGTNDKATTFQTLQDDLAAVLALLGSLDAGAKRRASQGRYDFAALLHYRCLELMSRRRLAVHDIDSEEKRLGLTQQYKLLNGQQIWYTEQRQRATLKLRMYDPLMQRASLRAIQLRLRMHLERHSGERDDSLEDDLLSLINTRNDARNQSVLAHGFRLIPYDEYRLFRNVTDVVLERFLAVEGQPSLDTWRAQFAFVQLSEANR